MTQHQQQYHQLNGLKMAECLYNFPVSSPLKYTLGAVNLILSIITVFGNTIVCFLVIGNKTLQTRSNLCLLSLACSDLCVGIIVEPLHVMQLFNESLRENCTINLVRRYLHVGFVGASLSSIVLISYDRYLQVSKTINYTRYMSKKKLGVLLAICWIIPLAIPFLRFSSEATYNSFILVSIASLVGVLSSCYVLIIRVVRNQENALAQHDINMRNKTAIESHIKMARAVLVILACLLVTMVPGAIFNGISAIDTLITHKFLFLQSTREVCYAVLITIAMANSAINPAIYYLKVPQFRSIFKSKARRFLRCFYRSTDDSSAQRKERGSTLQSTT